MRHLLVASAIAVVLGACGGAPQPLVISGIVPVIITPSPDKLPFDPRGARLQSATSQLTAIAGHPVALLIDAALTDEYRSGFDDQLIAIIENIGRDLESLKKNSPIIFARAIPLLQKVECRYSAIKKNSEAHFDANAKAVIVSEPARYGSLVERGMVETAVLEEFEQYIEKLYSTAQPDAIPAKDRGIYFMYLVHTRPGYGNLLERTLRKKLKEANPAMSPAEELASDPHAEVILRVLRLSELVGSSDQELAGEMREWLAEKVGYFSHTRSVRPELAEAAPEKSTFRRAEVAWARWLSATLKTWTPREQLQLARTVFPGRGHCPSYSRPCIKPKPALASFDAFAFGLSIENAWARTGHPSSGKDDDTAFELNDMVVCPHFTDADGKRTRNRSCNSTWYLQALDDAPSRKRLADAIVAQNDAAFTETVFANLRYAQPEELVAMWRALEPHPREWKLAAEVIVQDLLDERDHTDDLVNEAKRLWRAAPDKRGTALYVIGSSQRHLSSHYGDRTWEEFSKRFGESVSAPVFASMLTHGPRAVPLAVTIWPALGKGYSRTDALAPHLDRFIDSSHTQPLEPGEPVRTLKGIVARMCAEQNTADVARLHAYLARRVGSHSAEATELATLLTDTANGHCPTSRTSAGDR